MSTVKKRVNISLPRYLEDVLEKLAKRDQVPQATKATELLRLAVEIEEDQVLNSIVSKRDVKGARFIPHKKAWV